MFGAWVAYPLLLLVLVLGAGTLVQLAAGRALPLALRLPCGFALVIVVMDTFTRTTATAPLAVAAVVVVAVIGLAVGMWPLARAADARPLLRALRPGPALGAALFVFAVWAAPIVLSGEATWGGYNKLNDMSIWLAIVDQALTHGRTISDLPPSTYSIVLSNYLTVGYPIGSFLPLGLGHALLGVDIAWLADPWMAFSGSMLALALYQGARRTVPSAPTWQAAIIAGLASVSTLLYGYYLWGGIKEQVGATLIATAAVTATLVLDGERRIRAAIPGALVVWAIVAAESPGGLVWIGPGGILALAVIGVRARVLDRRTAPRAAPQTEKAKPAPAKAATKTPARTKSPARAKAPAPVAGRATRKSVRAGAAATKRARPRTPGANRGAAALAAVRGPAGAARDRLADLTVSVYAVIGVILVALGAVLVLRGGGFVETFKTVLTSGSDLGSLAHPLDPLQTAGIWFNGDFRYGSADRVVAYLLIAIVLAAAVYAFVVAVRRGRWELVLYELFALTGAGLAVLFASPWVAGKALASAAPALPFAALVAAALLARRQVVAGAIVAVLIAGGILWSDALGYHDVQLAPRALFSSLASIAPSVGPGPTLMTEYSVFGVRHFLRNSSSEDPEDLRSRLDPLANGKLVSRPDYADLDEIALNYSLLYPTIVLQNSPVLTRPAAAYELVAKNADWQVWKRPATLPPLVSYLPIGDLASALHPGTVPACRNVVALSHVRGATSLIAAPAVDPVSASAVGGTHPAGWARKGMLWMHGTGTATIPFTVPTAGRYGVWLEGSIQSSTSIAIDGHPVGSVSDAQQQLGQFVSFGDATLTAGGHVAVLHHSASWLAPGSGYTDIVGPLVLSPDVPAPALIDEPAANALQLCGRSLSWIDALGA